MVKTPPGAHELRLPARRFLTGFEGEWDSAELAGTRKPGTEVRSSQFTGRGVGPGNSCGGGCVRDKHPCNRA